MALLVALTFTVATLGINVVANFVLAAFELSTIFLKAISFKKGGYIAAGNTLMLYPLAPWKSNAAQFVDAIGATMGPLLGSITLIDCYLIARGNVNVPALCAEHGEYRYEDG